MSGILRPDGSKRNVLVGSGIKSSASNHVSTVEWSHYREKLGSPGFFASRSMREFLRRCDEYSGKTWKCLTTSCKSKVIAGGAILPFTIKTIFRGQIQ